MKNEMQKKVCLITGATSGIGKITATALAAKGARVVVAGRNPQKTENVAARIRAETGNRSVDYMIADFGDLARVRCLAASFKKRYSRLDVLLNNAGALFNKRVQTPCGAEKTFLVNHLSPFLLTRLLLDMILASAPARIINVSSDAHKHDTLDLDNLGFERGFSRIKAYARSKLANLMFTYELARRLEGTGVTVNAVHPGVVATNIWKTGFPLLGPVIQFFMDRMALTAQQGADPLIYLASSPEVADMTGKYFVRQKISPSSFLSCDRQKALLLWDISKKMTMRQPE